MKWTNVAYGMNLMLLGLIFLSCEKDQSPVIVGDNELDISPSISMNIDGLLSSEALNIIASKTLNLKITARHGTSPFDIFRIKENRNLIDPNRIFHNEYVFNANSKLILGEENEGITYDLEIETIEFGEISSYSISLEYENGLFTEDVVSICTIIETTFDI
tara:strand:+ start:150 stop:632 length:483 start_codon:yes stop_codon:yes gene_type:complete